MGHQRKDQQLPNLPETAFLKFLCEEWSTKRCINLIENCQHLPCKHLSCSQLHTSLSTTCFYLNSCFWRKQNVSSKMRLISTALKIPSLLKFFFHSEWKKSKNTHTEPEHPVQKNLKAYLNGILSLSLFSSKRLRQLSLSSLTCDRISISVYVSVFYTPILACL